MQSFHLPQISTLAQLRMVPATRDGIPYSDPTPPPISLATHAFQGGGGGGSREGGIVNTLGTIPTMMQALRLHVPGAEPQFSMKQVATPLDLKPGEVLLKINRCGVCGSDFEGIFGHTGRRNPSDTEAGLTLGHEASGTIVAVTKEALDKGWNVGARVTFDSSHFCGGCPKCQKGQTNLCSSMQVYGAAPKGGYVRHGAMADYLAVSSRGLFALPDNVSFDAGAMIEPIAVGLQAIQRAQLDFSTPILVVGSGLIGGLLLKSLKALGYGNIMAVDTEQSRVDLAIRCGAALAMRNERLDRTLTGLDLFSAAQRQFAAMQERYTNASEIEPSFRESCAQTGFPVVFEVVGFDSSFALVQAAVAKGGTIVAIGNASNNVNLNLQYLVTRGVEIRGSVAAVAADYRLAIDLIAEGKLKPEDMITDRIGLNELPELVRHRSPDRLKVMLEI